jgi:hypothetical protein
VIGILIGGSAESFAPFELRDTAIA